MFFGINIDLCCSRHIMWLCVLANVKFGEFFFLNKMHRVYYCLDAKIMLECGFGKVI